MFSNDDIVEFFPHFFLFPAAFYEEEVAAREEKLKHSATKIEHQKNKSGQIQQKMAEMHHHSTTMQQQSSQYSEEVLEWQRMAKKEKSVSTQREQKIIAVSINFD